MKTDNEKQRLDYFSKVQEQTPDDFRKQYMQNIIDGVVVEGMTPYETYLAGGQFAYKVSADTEVWSAGSDPMRIMWMQTHRPDNSKIIMMFRNKSQYKSKESTPFRVIFKLGLVIKIEKQSNE